VRKLTIAVLGLTLFGAGAFAGRALYEWEWTRAMWMTVGFVAVEVALFGVLVLGRLKDLSAELERDRAHQAVRGRLVEARPPSRDHFDWLRDATGRTNVFVTMVVGGGIILSGMLWLVDLVARRTTTPAMERRLAGRLQAIAPPVDGLAPPDDVLVAEDLPSGERDDLWLLLTGRHGLPSEP
jgi:hypothetical protein